MIWLLGILAYLAVGFVLTFVMCILWEVMDPLPESGESYLARDLPHLLEDTVEVVYNFPELMVAAWPVFIIVGIMVAGVKFVQLLGRAAFGLSQWTIDKLPEKASWRER